MLKSLRRRGSRQRAGHSGGGEGFPAEFVAAVGANEATDVLGHGGRRVQAVLRHRLQPVGSESAPRWVIEKQMRAGPRQPPSPELLFYAEVAPAVRLDPLDLPQLLFAGRLGAEDRLLLERVDGRSPIFSHALEPLGQGIATLELSSSAWLAGLSPRERQRLAPLVFFAPGGRRGFRGHYALYLARLSLRVRKGRASGLPRLLRIGLRLAALERQVRRQRPCICHLDLSSKNLIRSGARLTLIDWGQASIGRPGFDLGAILARLARKSQPQGYRRLRKQLLDAHAARLGPAAPELLAAGRAGMAFYCACALLFHLALHPPEGPQAGRRLAWFLRCIERELGLAR